MWTIAPTTCVGVLWFPASLPATARTFAGNVFVSWSTGFRQMCDSQVIDIERLTALLRSEVFVALAACGLEDA